MPGPAMSDQRGWLQPLPPGVTVHTVPTLVSTAVSVWPRAPRRTQFRSQRGRPLTLSIKRSRARFETDEQWRESRDLEERRRIRTIRRIWGIA